MARKPMPATVREHTDVVVSCGDQVPVAQREQVADAVRQVLERQGGIEGARVRLTTLDHGGPMLVQVNLHVRETPTRVQAVTSGADDLRTVISRLDRQITHTGAPWRPRPWPDRTRRILSAAGGDAVVGRRKHVVLQATTPLEAIAVMDAMDFDTHLFIDAETGEDAVVYRASPSGLRLARQRRMYPPGWSWAPPVEACPPPVPLIVNSHPTPVLTETDAVARMCEHGRRSLFFTNADTGRGQLLYPRYDGTLGMIIPATASTAVRRGH